MAGREGSARAFSSCALWAPTLKRPSPHGSEPRCHCAGHSPGKQPVLARGEAGALGGFGWGVNRTVGRELGRGLQPEGQSLSAVRSAGRVKV